MRLGLVYGPFCLGSPDRVFDLDRVWSDDRGLTGSELAFFRLAQEMSSLGHDVTMFTFAKGPLPAVWEGIRVLPFEELKAVGPDWDAVMAWNEAEVLRDVTPDVLRCVNLQINSFTHCLPGFDDHVDLWTSPSTAHREMVLGRRHPVGTDRQVEGAWHVADPGKWEVLTNGTDLELYDGLAASGVSKAPGRVIWASSPDRGLHWLLQTWPEVRRRCPRAHLRIFYRIRSWLDHFLGDPHGRTTDWTLEEQRSRANYIAEALRRLEGHGVELMHSVSRERIVKEMAEAQVLAYPCDPVCWTEGFSVTLMEACAARTVPVTTDVDALGSIYGALPTVVRAPVGDRLEEFTGHVVKALSDPEFREEVSSIGRGIAERHSWRSVAGKLDRILTDRVGRKARGG